MKNLTRQRTSIKYRTKLGQKKLRIFGMEETPKDVGRAGSHRGVCSCAMCGNPRRSKLLKGKERLTFQERKAALSMMDDFE